MNTPALIMMVTTELIVSIITVYFFYRILVSSPKPEPDSFSENDDIVERQK